MNHSKSYSRFLTTCKQDMKERGIDALDVIFITPDAYVDHPAFAASLLGRLLEREGYSVGIISQPDVKNPESITQLGAPNLFFAVTCGSLDSMVANYTPTRKPRSDDPYSPGGKAGGRPDRVITVYCQMIRSAFRKSVFIVAGGLEASLRRFSHYDFVSEKIRRPLMMDIGADICVFGMGERALLEIASKLKEIDAVANNLHEVLALQAKRLNAVKDVKGVVYKTPKSAPKPENAVELPSCEEVEKSKEAFAKMFSLFERTYGSVQFQDCSGMRVIANEPQPPLTSEELDAIYELPFTRDAHPMYGFARIPALEQVRFSIVSHRGCVGGCAFCAITAHQGKAVSSRGADSIIKEENSIIAHRHFRGTINDIGGPSANMYGFECKREFKDCPRPSCLFPQRCANLVADQTKYLDLLKRASKTRGARNIFITTGVRYDLILEEPELLRKIALDHTSGFFKVAPEHMTASVLKFMRKCGPDFTKFIEAHGKIVKNAGKKQYVLPYLMAAHPGCALDDMIDLALFMKERGIKAEQCQIFTPTPGTASSVMYATGLDPSTLQPVYVEKKDRMKNIQKALILYHLPESKPLIMEALRVSGRQELTNKLLN